MKAWPRINGLADQPRPNSWRILRNRVEFLQRRVPMTAGAAEFRNMTGTLVQYWLDFPSKSLVETALDYFENQAAYRGCLELLATAQGTWKLRVAFSAVGSGLLPDQRVL